MVMEHSFEFSGRDVKSICWKYISLYRKKIPTGDPNMPSGGRMEKRIKYKIGNKAELDDDMAEYDILGQIPELRVLYYVYIENDNSPLVGDR